MNISHNRKQNWLYNQKLISTKFDKAYWRSNRGSIILKISKNDKKSQFEYPWEHWNSFVLQNQREYKFIIDALIDDFKNSYPKFDQNENIEICLVIRGKAQILKLDSTLHEFEKTNFNTWISVFEFFCGALLTYDLFEPNVNGDKVLIEGDCKHIFSDIQLVTLLPYDEKDLKNIINQIYVNKINGFQVHNIVWNPDLLNF